jgi:hypothetical protein
MGGSGEEVPIKRFLSLNIFISDCNRAILRAGEINIMMRPLDVPEVLIILGLLGALGLALYNRMHRDADAPKQR